MLSVTQTGIVGIQNGMRGMQKAASEVASAQHFNPQNLNPQNLNNQGSDQAVPSKEMVESIIEMKMHAQQVQASAQMIQTANDAIGAILDVLA